MKAHVAGDGTGGTQSFVLSTQVLAEALLLRAEAFARARAGGIREGRVGLLFIEVSLT